MANFSFNDVPVLRHSRSRFDLSHSVKTSANVGTLYPFELQEVYAGDTFKVHTATVSRLSSQFIRPVMDNLFLDVYYFFVPSRILYDKYPNVFGENTESAWANTQDYAVPQIPAGQAIPSKSVGDYLGLPVEVPLSTPVSVLPFRAFAKVYEDWFRDQNNVPPMHIQNGEVNVSEKPNSNAWAPGNYTGMCPPVAKFHDYFTSSLPSPQKGDAVTVPITNGSPIPVSASGLVRVHGDTTNVSPTGRYATSIYYESPVGYEVPPGSTFYAGVRKASSGSNPALFSRIGQSDLSGSPVVLYPTNLVADFSNQGSVDPSEPFSLNVPVGAQLGDVTVNDLRLAFQTQKMLERDARSGSRFVEYLASHFGVQAGDYRLQRSEFLGGRRTPISIHQVVQSTGSGDDSSPLAEVGAYSLSNSRSRFTKSFTEPGYVLGVFCIRQHHSYQQGVEKFWTRTKRTDFYDPVFSHIGEQPVMTTELYAEANKDSVFGYNEAWADLRYRPNRISGQMRSAATDSLDVWHFADNYLSAPTLNSQFVQETPAYVNRAIVVDSSAQDQFILDFWVQNIAYRVLPTYSVPSLVDHD